MTIGTRRSTICNTTESVIVMIVATTAVFLVLTLEVQKAKYKVLQDRKELRRDKSSVLTILIVLLT